MLYFLGVKSVVSYPHCFSMLTFYISYPACFDIDLAPLPNVLLDFFVGRHVSLRLFSIMPVLSCRFWERILQLNAMCRAKNQMKPSIN